MDPADIMAQISAQLARMPSLTQALNVDASPTQGLDLLKQAEAAVRDLDADRQTRDQKLARRKAAREQAARAPRPPTAAGPPVVPPTPPPDNSAQAARAVTDQVRSVPSDSGEGIVTA